MVPRAGVQAPRRGLVDEKGASRPGFWSSQCHTVTLGLHLVDLSLSLLIPHTGMTYHPPSHRVLALNPLMNVEVLQKIHRVLLI